MYWLDTVLIVVIVFSTFLGLRTGIIKSVLSLAGLIVGVILAGRYSGLLSNQLTFIPSEGMAKIAAFIIILIGVMVAAVVLASLLKWAASAMMLGWVNYLGGAILGLMLGAIFCSALLAIWVKWLGISSAVTESIVATILLDKFPLILTLLPDEFESIRSFFQ